jgi:hypothetical protein
LKESCISKVTCVTDSRAWRDSKFIPTLAALCNIAKLRHRFYSTANHPLRLLVLDTTQQETIFFIIQGVHHEEVHLAQTSIAHTSSRMPGNHSLGNKISVWFEEVFEAADTIFGYFLVVAGLYSADKIGRVDAGDGVERDVEPCCWFLL